MTDELDRAIDRIMGVGIEAMGGDNLAVLLCSHFDDPDDGSDMDDTGWSETATNAYEEIKREIEGLFVPVRAELAAMRQEIEAQIATTERTTALAQKAMREVVERDAMIHQLGENAAKAAGEYAEEVGRLRADLAQNAEAVTSCEGCNAPLFDGDSFVMSEDASGCWAMMTCNHRSAENTPCYAYRVGKPSAHARAALTEPTDG